jgi:hypothetical protein
MAVSLRTFLGVPITAQGCIGILSVIRVSRGDAVRSERVALWQAGAVGLSVFGPYVAGAARTEQIVVFALAAWVLVTGWPRMIHAPFGPLPFLVVWFGLLAVMTVSTVFRPFDPGFFGFQPPSHALAAYLIPVAMMVLTWWWSLLAEPVTVLRVVAPVVVCGMCVNAVIQWVQLGAGNAALGILPQFWDAAPSSGSVAALAATDGRYTGIFDQPAETGIASGVALLLLIWLARQHAWRSTWVAVAAVLVVSGGVITLSKVFLLAALPAAAVTVLRGYARVRVIAAAAAAAGAAWLAGTAGLLPGWHAGGAYLTALTHPTGSLTAVYTAGRYGSGGTLTPEFTDVMRAAPIAGFGAGGLDTAYDSLWQQAFIVAGIMGVVLMAAVVVMLARRLVTLRCIVARREWQLATGVLFLAVASSAGIPSLTANRAGTLLWLVLGLLLCSRGPDVARQLGSSQAGRARRWAALRRK